jgi:hypothetical protein
MQESLRPEESKVKTRSFCGPDPKSTAEQVVEAIRARNWPPLKAILDGNPKAVGTLTKWQRPEGPPAILDAPEVQEIPALMLLHGGKVMVRYDIPDEPEVYKLEVIVEQKGSLFEVIDFWGLGW